jgi:hypothetical protein
MVIWERPSPRWRHCMVGSLLRRGSRSPACARRPRVTGCTSAGRCGGGQPASAPSPTAARPPQRRAAPDRRTHFRFTSGWARIVDGGLRGERPVHREELPPVHIRCGSERPPARLPGYNATLRSGTNLFKSSRRVLRETPGAADRARARREAGTGANRCWALGRPALLLADYHSAAPLLSLGLDPRAGCRTTPWCSGRAPRRRCWCCDGIRRRDVAAVGVFDSPPDFDVDAGV